MKKAHPKIKESPRVQAERRQIMGGILENEKGIESVCWEEEEGDTKTGMSPRGRLLFRYLAVSVYRDKTHMRWPIRRTEDEEAFVDLLSMVAMRASKNRRHWFEMDWLLLLGVSPEGLDHFRKLYCSYEMLDIPDNRISNEFPLMFKRNLRDLALIFVFLDKIMSIRRTETRSLDARVMANQVEAARFRYKIPPWCPTPSDITTKRYCGGCGAWADVIVTPDSKPSSVYATGLRAASFDAITGELRCKKGMTQGCRKPLIEVDLRGQAILVSAVKRPPKWYTLCATCAALTVLTTERIDYRGPNCGMHPVTTEPPPRHNPLGPPSPAYVQELRRARYNCGLEERCLEQEEFLCASCHAEGTLLNMHRVPVLDNRTGTDPRKYPRVHMVLCRQDYNRIKRILAWTPKYIEGDAKAWAKNRASWPKHSYILYTEVLALVINERKRNLFRNVRSGIKGFRAVPEHKYPDKT